VVWGFVALSGWGMALPMKTPTCKHTATGHRPHAPDHHPHATKHHPHATDTPPSANSLQSERAADRATLDQLQRIASEEARQRGEGLGDVRGEVRQRQAALLSDMGALAREVEGYRCVFCIGRGGGWIRVGGWW